MKSKQDAISTAKELQSLFLSREYWVFCAPNDSADFSKVIDRILEDTKEDARCLFNKWIGDLVFIRKSPVSFATLFDAIAIAPKDFITYRDAISPDTPHGRFLIGALEDALTIDDIDEYMDRHYKGFTAGTN